MKNIRLLLLSFFAFPFLLSAHGWGSSGVVSGFTHPILDLDHLFAILALGLLCALLYDKVANTFIFICLLAMFMGGISGVFNFEFSFMEAGIALSTVVFGVSILIYDQIKTSLLTFFVGLFAWIHGLAFGIEMDPDFHLVPFFFGFLAGALVILLIGRTIGRFLLKNNSKMLFKVLAVGFILMGLFFLFD